MIVVDACGDAQRPCINLVALGLIRLCIAAFPSRSCTEVVVMTYETTISQLVGYRRVSGAMTSLAIVGTATGCARVVGKVVAATQRPEFTADVDYRDGLARGIWSACVELGPEAVECSCACVPFGLVWRGLDADGRALRPTTRHWICQGCGASRCAEIAALMPRADISGAWRTGLYRLTGEYAAIRLPGRGGPFIPVARARPLGAGSERRRTEDPSRQAELDGRAPAARHRRAPGRD
jgi:hypothetical protein